MQLNIHDLTGKRVAYINNKLPNALHYFDDNWHRYLAEGTSTFDFSVNKVNPDYAYLTLQNYISLTYDDEDYFFTILSVKQSHDTMEIQCGNLNLGLIYEEVGAYSNTKRHSIVWYLRNCAQITDNILEIGQNPFSTVDEDISNPILVFDNSETKLARIISICNSFNAEFQFRTELKNDGKIQSISIDLYGAGGVGQKRKDVTLYYGKNVTGISSTAEKSSKFFNATTVTDSSGKYNWLAVEGKVYNSAGQLEFYKNAGENMAYAPLSRDQFPSQLKTTSADRYTRRNLSYAATSADSLWDYAVSQFKLYAYPEMTYDVTVSVNAITNALGNDRKLDIGDTITIQDKTFDKADGGLILEARVSEQEISFTNPLNNKLKFTNFVRLQSQISDSLTARMNQLVSEATPYRSEITTTNGTQFKNNVTPVSTVLKATIFKGNAVSETTADSYEWFKDGVSVGSGQSYTVLASTVTTTAVYSYESTINGQVVGRKEVTITNVNDGANGKTGSDGKNGISVFLTNEAVTIAGNTTSAIATTTATDITAYQGATALSVSVGTLSGLPTGISAVVSNNGTTKATVTFTVTTALTTKSGSITIPVTTGGLTINQTFSYSLALKGDTGLTGLQGKDGTDGVAGPAGIDGKTSYTHIAYANSADGKTDFSTSDSTNRSYIGVYVDFTKADSTIYSDYKWTLVKGATGNQGVPGVAGTDGKTPYFHTAYANGLNGEDFTTTSPNLNLINFKTGLTLGNFLNWSSGVTMTDNLSRATFDYIAVTPNAAYTVSADWAKTTGVAVFAFETKADTTAKYIFDASKGWIALNTSGHSIPKTTVITVPAGINFLRLVYMSSVETNLTLETLLVAKPKMEVGTVATPFMLSENEVTTNDYPKCIGTLTDFVATDSENYKDYTWSLIRGQDGTSVTITSTSVTYQNSTSGTTAPTGTWSTIIPSTNQGQYRWSKTVVTYSSGTPTTTYLVAYVAYDGKIGPAGSPTGVTQSDTEPSSKYAGMMWQYTGANNTTVGGVTIKPQEQYIFDGSIWKIHQIVAANIKADTLSTITADLGTVNTGKIYSLIDYTYYNNSATGVKAKAILDIDISEVNQKIGLKSLTDVDWSYTKIDPNGLLVFTDTQNAGAIGSSSGRYVQTTYSGSGIGFVNSQTANANNEGDLVPTQPYTGQASLYFNGKK